LSSFQNPKVPPPPGGSHLHAHTREAYAAIVSERYALKRELAQTRPSLDEVRDAMRALRVAVLARQQAEPREIAPAKATERGNGFGHPAQEVL